jgi:hypothetical protein
VRSDRTTAAAAFVDSVAAFADAYAAQTVANHAAFVAAAPQLTSTTAAP